MPRLESLAVVKGEHVCTQRGRHPQRGLQLVADDRRRDPARRPGSRRASTRSAASSTSPCRRPGRRSRAPGGGRRRSGRSSSARARARGCIPSVATWLSGQLGIYQTHGSFDLVAACAGFPYGLGEAVRLLQEVKRPVLVVCAEKFSDKIGSVRTSRMIFGDGASRARRRARRAGRGARHRGRADLRQRPGQRGELDHLAEPRVRQQHHRLRAGGQGAREALPRPDDGRAQALPAPDGRPRLAARGHRPRRPPPGEQDDGRQARRTRPASRRIASTSTSRRWGTSPPPASPSRIYDAVRGASSTGRCGCSPPASEPARWAATR